MIEYLKTQLPTAWTEKCYGKDELIIDEYEKTARVYYVVSGVACVEILNDEQQYISAFIFQNDFFGLDSFSTFKQKEHAIRSLSEETIIFSLPKKLLLQTLNGRPEYYDLLLTNFADIFQRHYSYFNFLYLSSAHRIKAALTYLSDYIGTPTDEDALVLPTFITQEILAKFCRTSQSRVSVTLSQLEKTGWIKKKKVPITIK